MGIVLCSPSRAVEKKKFIVAYNDATEALILLVKAVYIKIGVQAEFILTPSERAIYGTNIGDIKNHSVGIIRGSKLPEMFITKENIKAEVANSFSNLYSMFKLGRFEIALITDTQLLSHSEQMSKISVQVGPALQSSTSFHVLNKRHLNLVSKFDSTLKKLNLNNVTYFADTKSFHSIIYIKQY